MLERATHLRQGLGDGSLTALPIIETEAQNISAYIPTNLISITDGQIYLSPSLFELGVLPAVDVAKSVSRVGGKAQRAAYRAVAGDLKLAYAQFEELETFARFGAHVDEDTRKVIEHGRRIRACLKQPEFAPVSVAGQIAVLLALTAKLFDSVPLDEMASAEKALQEAAESIPADLLVRFDTEALNDADRETITAIARETLARFYPRPESSSEAKREPRTKVEGQAMAPTKAKAPSEDRTMSAAPESLRRKIESAGDLQSVVRTMKVLAASSIVQYENSVRALADYDRIVGLGLSACFRDNRLTSSMAKGAKTDLRAVGAIVFGSDQGLVGRFNEKVADDAMEVLGALRGKAQVWVVGQRVHARLADAGLPLMGLFPVPNSVQAIASLVGQILVAGETPHDQPAVTELHLFYNGRTSAAVCTPVRQRLLPLDDEWRQELIARSWPTKNLPEVLGDGVATLRSLIREYLFRLSLPCVCRVAREREC